MDDGKVRQDIETFLAGWPGETQPMRDWFRLFYDELSRLPDVALSFAGRPGISFSMRPKHARQAGRNFFAIVDVIDDDPAARWLSVCFYGDMITDPDVRGEVIPGGLAGDDGYCFDMYENDETLARYLVDRLHEAAGNAAKE